MTEKRLLKQKLVTSAVSWLQSSLQLECRFLKVSLKCSEPLGCHDGSPTSGHRRLCSDDSSPLKAAGYKGRVSQLASNGSNARS